MNYEMAQISGLFLKACALLDDVENKDTSRWQKAKEDLMKKTEELHAEWSEKINKPKSPKTIFFDDLIDKKCKIEERNLKPEYVIVGRKEADILMEEERNLRAHKPMSDDFSSRSEVLGMQVVFDWTQASCVKVVEGFCHDNWCRRGVTVEDQS